MQAGKSLLLMSPMPPRCFMRMLVKPVQKVLQGTNTDKRSLYDPRSATTI